MEKRRQKKIFIISILIFLALLTGCINVKLENESTVREKCSKYLKDKYNKEFEILQFKQMFHGGLWKYETDLKAAPVDNKSLTFWMKYDAKERIVQEDNYKKAFWEYQIEKDLKPIIEPHFKVLEFDSRLSKNGSIAFLNSAMEFYSDYKTLAKNIELPVLNLTIRLIGDYEEPSKIKSIIEITQELHKTEFIKIQFSVFFYKSEIIKKKTLNFTTNSNILNEEYCIKQLHFKTTKELPIPTRDIISSLIYDYRTDTLFKTNQVLFDTAEKARLNNDTSKALKLYNQIISSVSPYRYSTYSPSESALSVESAFRAGEIYEATKEFSKARENYQLVIEKLKYEEVRLHLSDFYKKAIQKIEKFESK